MSTAPWGTMNDWLRVEGEQRGAWLARRVQDVRAANVARRPATVRRDAEPAPAPRPAAEPAPVRSLAAEPAPARTPAPAAPCACAEVA